MRLIERELGENARYLHLVNRVKNYQGVMALWPWYE